MITQKRLKEVLNYNTETGIFTRLISTTIAVKVGDIAGRIKKNGYSEIMVDSKRYPSHRLAWLYVYGEMPKNEIDHIDGNPRNNSINNLRECNRFEQHQNRASSKSGSSKYLGVYWHKTSNKWAAQIRSNKKSFHLGFFETEESAFNAYCSAKKLFHTFNPIPREVNL